MTLTRSPWSVTTAGLGAWATESLLAAAEVLLTEPRAAWRLLPSPFLHGAVAALPCLRLSTCSGKGRRGQQGAWLASSLNGS